MSLGAIFGGIEAGAGLLGLGHNPYSAQAKADLSRGRGYLGQYGAVGSREGGLADSAFSDYGQDNGAYRAAVGQQEQYLQQDPYTDSNGAARIAGASAGAAQAFTAARAHLQAHAAASGMTGSGSLAGALGASYNAEAANSAGLQNGLALSSIASRGQRLGQLTALTGGVAGQSYQKGVSALDSEGSIDRSLGSDYLGLGSSEQSQSQAYDQAQYGEIGDGLGAIATQATYDKYGFDPLGRAKGSVAGGTGAASRLPGVGVALPSAGSFWNYRGG